ncbi:hypothetical protein PYW08_002143 [Mythimna loreyi]|uniref:Uncharacterized protein n=1 Tax=Mythimna loreyi TaxID=667449 RepID=A0ACC2R1W1_9NEOP|nr:hypothetical protein PYW08_002143 [Mythimna loreyi]
MFPSEVSQSNEAQFCISWESYKKCISNGFSRFQQNGEFVDMTLAAEGYLVKVHQNIVALASPYLKAMILSASCQHPVVFLNNITQEILSFILEYMYTGEVNIPKNAAPAFIDACKALHITGVENLYLPKRPVTEPAELVVQEERVAEPPLPPPPPDNNFAAHITINSDNFNVEVIPNENDPIYHLNEVQPMNISLDNDIMNYKVLTDVNIVTTENNLEQDFPPPSDYELPVSPLSRDREEHQSKTLISSDHNTTTQDLQNITLKLKENHSSTVSTGKVIAPKISDRNKTQHFSISNRGSLQLLLNRFIYHCHHQSCDGRKKRWRCMDYRKLRCPAVVDMQDEDIVHRSEDHSHPDHDARILRKFKSKQVYTTLALANDRIPEKPAQPKSRKRFIPDENQAYWIYIISLKKMVQSQFSLSWDSYKSSICSGFSALQQNGEFVDMTIAADGHFVKVHQVLVALASPYLKDLITSAPCQHPVIFLNNVAHRTLCLLLEYIYTGEVVVPADCLTSFAETAKSLHIKGLENIGTAQQSLPVRVSGNMPQLDDSDMCQVSGMKRSLPSDKLAQVTLPTSARKIFIKQDLTNKLPSMSSINLPVPITTPVTTHQEDHDFSDLMDESGAQDDDDMDFKIAETKDNQVRDNKDKPSSSNLQFTVSIRGSLQVILNRYIYNLHSTTSRAGLRRWRCVDYRNNKCTAFLVTKGNVVLNRANMHNHSFHDKKILAKIEKKAVYSAIDEVEGYKDLPLEGQTNILSLEEFPEDKNDSSSKE